MPLKNGSGLITLVNWYGILKLWAIAHENSQKSRKRWFFCHASQTCIASYGACKSPRNPKTMSNNSWKWPKMEKNDECFVVPLKHGSVLTGLVNCPRNLKLWFIAHENSQKCVKDLFLDMPLENGSGYIALLNWSGILKLCTIAHENSQKSRKWRVSCHASRTFIGSYGPCKSPSNPRSMDNNSWKRPKMAKTTSFFSCLPNLDHFLQGL